MYTVYIVDDENLIIDSLIEAVDWAGNGFVLCGTSTDSAVAFDEICKLKPDLIFSDLKMPTMSGISLITECRKQNIDAEFILLSAFAQFDASRQFFLQGGFDYILKPINSENLQLTLDNVLRKLMSKKPLQPIIADSDETKDRKNSDTFLKLLTYLEDNIDKKHSLKSLSEKFYFSETYICDLFAKKLSITFTVHMANLRMKKAAELVLETNKSMKEVGLLCGYGNYFYFCRVFKSFYGMSPSEYKQSGHSGQNSDL